MTDSFDRGDAGRSAARSLFAGGWDEARWEVFLQDHEVQLERFLQDVQAFLTAQLDPELGAALPLDRAAALLTFLQARGWQDPEAFVSWLDAEQHTAAPPDALVEAGTALAARLSGWGEALPAACQDAALVTLLVACYDSVSMLTRAARFGAAPETFGGAIACTKRALGHAHTAITSMADVRRRLASEGATEAAGFAEALHEHRNAIALRVVALREQWAAQAD